MPLGATIHNIEITLGKGGQLARAAGAVAKIIAKEGTSATLKGPYGEVFLISKNCSATVGQVGNVEGLIGKCYKILCIGTHGYGPESISMEHFIFQVKSPSEKVLSLLWNKKPSYLNAHI
ncbi:ribosomal protein L2 [Tanacetum coccineum]